MIMYRTNVIGREQEAAGLAAPVLPVTAPPPGHDGTAIPDSE